VLNPNMAGTELMLSPFEPWSNCTMVDVARGKTVAGPISARFSYRLGLLGVWGCDDHSHGVRYPAAVITHGLAG
jgi:hypothetical protein